MPRHCGELSLERQPAAGLLQSGGVLEQHPRRRPVVRDSAAAGDHNRPRRQARDSPLARVLVEAMLDEHDRGCAGSGRLDGRADRRDALWVEHRGGLVEHKDSGLVDDGSREGNPLRLAAGERGRTPVDQRRGADELERSLHGASHGGGWPGVVFERKRDLVGDVREAHRRTRVLRHDREQPGERRHARLPRIRAANADAAADLRGDRVGDDPTECLQQRGLPRTRRTDDKQALAWLDPQVHGTQPVP